MNDFSGVQRLVIKVGSSSLTHPTGHINIRQVERLAKVLADIKNAGREVILVSSGAIAVGGGKLGLAQRPTDLATKQAAAAVGQCELMYLYDKLFSEYNHMVAQVLLTRDIMDHPARKQHCIRTLRRLWELGVIPVVNENDTVAVEEIEFGDNDTLSALVAVLAGADGLILMSDIDGLYDCDPRKNPDARLIRRVEEIDARILAAAEGAGSAMGTGGMATKIHAAQIATEAGIAMAIVNSADPAVLYELLDGNEAGTIFLPRAKEQA